MCVCMYVYLHVYVCVLYVCVYMGIHMCVRKLTQCSICAGQRLTLESFIIFPSYCFMEEPLLEPGAPLSWMDGLASELLGSPCLRSPGLGFQPSAAVPGGDCMSSGIFTLQQQTPPTEPSAYTLLQKEIHFML